MMVKINDIVRFLNDVGGGKVTRIDDNIAYVEDEDGFERPALVRELVVVGEAGTKTSTYERPIAAKSKLADPQLPKVKIKPAITPKKPVYETPEGEKLNIVLAFEPKEIKHLNTTTFYAILVNDSNYYLNVAYMTRSDDENEWHTRYIGQIEPNMQVDIDEFTHADLNNIEHIAVQYIAYKQDKGFKLKNPALVEQKIDTTKFYKLHSFHSSEYFDNNVIELYITRGDVPTKQMFIDSSALERAMREKRHADRPQARKVQHHEKKRDEIIVQDLHIAELLDDFTGMNNSDILNYQLEKFREVMTAHRNAIGQKIVFIHGKGEGVLRRALLDELRRKWPGCDVQDASFQEYGFGATQVTIHKK